jgi:CHASE3 domain sensor protein
MGSSKLFHIKLIFAFAVALLLTLSIFSFLRVSNLLKTSEMVNHTNIIKLELESIFSRIKDADSEQRGFVLTKDTVYISQFKHSLKDIATRLHKLDQLTKDNYSQQRNIEDFRWVINKRVIHMEGVIRDTQEKPDQKITKERWLEARAIMDEIKLQTNKMMNEESFLLKLRTKSFTEESTFTPLFTIFLTICSIIIMIAAYYGISRD